MKKSLIALFSLCIGILFAGTSTDQQQRVADGYRLEGAALKATASIYGTQETIPATDAIEVFSNGYASSGFYNMKQNWDTARIKQIEITACSDQPGYFRLSGNLEKDGVRTQFKCTIASVIPDGQYRTYTFQFDNNSAWEGILTNWELSWLGPKGAHIGLKSMDTLPYTNALPNASAIIAGEPAIAPYLRPRAQCRLSWREGTCPGVTLRFYDYKMNEIPASAVELPAGQKSVEFTTPAEMILTKATVNGEAAGLPVIQQLSYTPMFQTKGKWRGNWLWFQKEEGPDDYNAWFETDIDLEVAPDYAVIAFAADDVAYIYVNRIYCGKSEIWHVPVRSNITHALKKGHNRIQVRVKNGSQAAGFAADVYVHAGGKDYYLDTDASWRCESKLNQPHKIPEVVEEPVVVLGNPHTTAPWNGSLGYRYAGPRGELRVTATEEGKFTAVVDKLPPEDIQTLKFILKDANGQEKSFSLPIKPASYAWKVGETITVEYRIPPLESGDYAITSDDDFVALTGIESLGTHHVDAKPIPEIQQARLVDVGTRPFIMLGDRKITPYFYHAIQTVRQHRFHEFATAEKLGTDNFRIPANIQNYWTDEETYDFTKFDEAVDQMFAAQPDAVFCVHINMQMPKWWLNKNPEEVMSFMDGTLSFADQYKQSFASQKWLTDGEKPIRALIDHIKQKSYADRVWGISIAEGNNGEWFWDCLGSKRQYDWGGYNKCDIEFFKECLRKKYGTDEALQQAWNDPAATIDGIDALPDWHLTRQGALGVLMDPTKDQRLMDWLESRNIALSHAINYFTGVVKDATDSKWLTGVYFGYLTELGCNNYRGLLLTGHNDLWEVLQSKNVDFLGAPSRYSYRKTGDSDGIMQPWTSLALHGKMVLNEMDYRSGYYRIPEPNDMRYYVGEPSTAYESVGHFDRAFGMNITTGIAGYWFDLCAGALYEKALDDVILEQEKLYEALPPVAGTTPCQIAIVGDIDSPYYTTNPDAKGIYTNAIEGLFSQISKLAVPYESMLINDLLDPTIQVAPHKLYIMLPTLVLDQQKRQALMQRFEAEGATVLWLYCAAPFYPGKPADATANADFLGIQTKLITDEMKPKMTTIPEYSEIRCANRAASMPWFQPVAGFDEIVGTDDNGEPWMVRKAIGNANHFYCALMNLPAELYGDLLGKCGIQRYVKGLDDRVWVGNDLLFIYAGKAGTKKLSLPKGYKAKSILGPLQDTTLPHNGTFEAKPYLTYGFIITK